MVPPQLSIEQGHAIASAIEYEIEQTVGEGNATAHVEPCQQEPCDLGDTAVEEAGPFE
jgi:divalent metal cation (Fe/Co/Zn/Cd) transporter